jgi:hypothetical protein
VVGLQLPVEVPVLADHQPVRRLVDEHARPTAFTSVFSAVVDVAPTRGSNTMSASSVRRMWWSGSHQLPMSAVNTSNARAIEASTPVAARTDVSAAESS